MNRYEAEFAKEKILGYYGVCPADRKKDTPEKAFEEARKEAVDAYKRMLSILENTQFSDIFNTK